MEGHLRKSKHIGFAAICIGILLIVFPAVLPVSPATQRFGPFKVDIRGDNCGPAGYVAFREESNSLCRDAAQRRLLTTTGIGLLVVAFGMALYAGGDDPRGSRIQVGVPRVKRSGLRSPGSRRYRPG
jgi:hypothetical protein